MKHILDYTRNEILLCLDLAGYGIELRDNTTDNLREILNELIQIGNAPNLEQALAEEKL